MSIRFLFSGSRALSVTWLIVSTAIVSAVIVSTAQAQYPPRNRNQVMQQPQRIKIAGTLMTSGQNQIQLSTNTNQTIYVMMGPDTEVSVTGKAEQDYLKSGVSVEFVADVDKTHVVKDPIASMTVVTPTTDRPLGLSSPESTASQNGAKKGDKANALGPPDPGFGPGPPRGRGNAEAGPLGGDLPASKPAKAAGGASKLPGTFTIRGTIKMCKDGKITLALGRGPTIKAELANDLKIDVDAADIRFAQRDDKVTVRGVTTQARPNLVMAESVAIEMAAPLSGAKKHSARPAKTPAARPSQPKKEAADAVDLPGDAK